MSGPAGPSGGDSSPFHAGERAVQARAGVREQIQQIESRLFHDFMPDPHRALFARLPYVIVGSLDDAHRPFASIVVGRPGFVSSPDPRTLRIGARALDGDPLANNLKLGAAVAVLGIELHTRRRIRMNGTVAASTEDGFAIHVIQSFGNCPRYIHARQAASPSSPANPTGAARTPRPVGAILSPRAASLVRGADTFFIASASAHVDGGDLADGVDVSHRGGKVGFVRLTNEPDRSVLTWPDFSGNYFFNTLGNLQVNPRAGLLFLDFETGDLLSLTGEATIIWSGSELAAFDGAERLLRFRVEEGVLVEGGVRLRWSPAREAPEVEATGDWEG